MWPFKESLKPEKRLSALEEDFDQLKRAFRALELEWEETLTRMRRSVQRNAKFLDKIREEGGEEEANPTPQPEGMTPTQASVQAAILARRRRNGVLPG